MGSHEVPVPGADLTPPGVAALIAQFLQRLDLTDVTIVANDTGGAISQIVMANHPERIGRVVLVACDASNGSSRRCSRRFTTLAKVPGVVWALVQSVRWRALHRLPITFGWVSKRPLPPDVVDSYLVPSRRDPAIRDDLRRFLVGIDRRHTLAAAQRLPAFTKPVLLVWAREDRLFPVSLAERLAAILPDATLQLVDDSYTFVSEDQPVALAQLVVSFLGARATP